MDWREGGVGGRKAGRKEKKKEQAALACAVFINTVQLLCGEGLPPAQPIPHQPPVSPNSCDSSVWNQHSYPLAPTFGHLLQRLKEVGR